MKLTIDIKGLAQVQDQIKEFSQRRLNAAIATGLTRTAIDVRDAVQVDMRQSLDRPTPYTLRSLFVLPAKADRLSAETYFKSNTGGSDTPATKYLLPQVDGGSSRTVKRFERALQAKGAMPAGWHAVPGVGARMDAFGNISRGQLVQILSQLGTELTAGFSRTISRDPRKRIAAQRRAGGQFISVMPGQRKGLQPGIYQRELSGRNLTPVLVFVRTVSFKRRFDFYGVSERVARERLGPNVERAVGDQLARLTALRGGV
jgi:hypothetical protein